jgi:hypothetical protein
MVVKFAGEGDAVVTITIDNLALLKFDVELYGIP